MIVEIEQTTITEIPYYDVISYHPLNPIRMAYYNILDIVSNTKILEIFTYDKPESDQKVIGAKTKSLERWE